MNYIKMRTQLRLIMESVLRFFMTTSEPKPLVTQSQLGPEHCDSKLYPDSRFGDSTSAFVKVKCVHVLLVEIGKVISFYFLNH